MEAAAHAVHVTYTTLRQLCQKRSDQSSPTSDKTRVDQLEAEVRLYWAITSSHCVSSQLQLLVQIHWLQGYDLMESLHGNLPGHGAIEPCGYRML